MEWAENREKRKGVARAGILWTMVLTMVWMMVPLAVAKGLQAYPTEDKPHPPEKNLLWPYPPGEITQISHPLEEDTRGAAQTFRGRVLDAYTGLPLAGATVVVLDTDPLRGAAADADGEFRVEGLPLGRIDIKVSMVGYEPVVLRNLLLVSARELVVEARLEELVYSMEGLVVRPDQRKDRPGNEMAMVSARSFTIDETERYAGSLGDPSRMAANFAGVSSVTDQRNDIVIRGNSPQGLLWRLEGVEIPNPTTSAPWARPAAPSA